MGKIEMAPVHARRMSASPSWLSPEHWTPRVDLWCLSFGAHSVKLLIIAPAALYLARLAPLWPLQPTTRTTVSTNGVSTVARHGCL